MKVVINAFGLPGPLSQMNEGKKAMQFLQQRRYIAVVVDGKVQFYRKAPVGGINHRGFDVLSGG